MFDSQSQNKPANGQMQTQSQKDTATQKQSKTPSGFGGGSAKGSFSFDLNAGADEEAFMRKPRSQAYMDIIASIDLLSATDEEIIAKLREVLDEDTLEEFMDMTPEEILEELRLTFAEEMNGKLEQLKALEEPQELVGVVCQCYINGCDIHAINDQGYILEHFAAHRPMPENLANGRIVYHKYKPCSCVEVYTNCCRVVMQDGSVETIMNRDIKE